MPPSRFLLLGWQIINKPSTHISDIANPAVAREKMLFAVN
jgi:hypothetical protein